jgi:hypothetical protein
MVTSSVMEKQSWTSIMLISFAGVGDAGLLVGLFAALVVVMK